MINLFDDLKTNSYPGRGIILGKSEDNRCGVIAYFIMGRSENSRNRVFEDTNDYGIKTKAFDESKLADPSLVIYSPVRILGENTIVTNGDQTDTIFQHMAVGESFESALMTRTFEPDPPIFTPRISGLVINKKDKFLYKLSILKSNDGDDKNTLRFFYNYENPIAGEGHFIHTYDADGNPPESFKGEPKHIAITGSINEFTDNLWRSLNEANKISLFVRYIDLEKGVSTTRILNKLK